MNRTTISLEPSLFRRLKQEAARQGKTFQECLNDYLRRGLDASLIADQRPEWRLPAFSLGRPRIDVADRESLDRLDRKP